MVRDLGRRFVHSMKVETYIVTWNREDTIHLTLSYYLNLGKVVLYDNFSDDRTREIAEGMGADVRLFGRAGQLDDQCYLDIKNHAWKKSKADWVIIVDADEILYHPNLAQRLQEATANGVTIFRPQGFSVYSDRMPLESWLEIETGFKDDKYSKLCCFNPQKITDIGYIYGCHEVGRRFPQGVVNFSNDLYLLHYHGVGGVERMIARHEKYAERLSPLNRRWGLGKEYENTPESKRKWFQQQKEKSYSFQSLLSLGE